MRNSLFSMYRAVDEAVKYIIIKKLRIWVLYHSKNAWRYFKEWD